MMKAVKQVQVYDPAMCCSTGVCGPDVDPVLVRFAADLKWLQEQGVQVQRFGLSQNPAAFVENELVKGALIEKGEAALPMVVSGEQVLASGRYPERKELAGWAGLAAVNELGAVGAAKTARQKPDRGRCCG